MYFMSFFMLFFLSMFMFFLSLFFHYLDFFLMIDYDLICFNSCSFVLTFLFDFMSLLFISVVFFISSMVVYYSYSYMFMDYNNRFLMLVLLFILSMFMMILSPNMISILLGWDGLGLISYCLVIYYQNISSYNAGMLTILSNRLGDVAIILCISFLFSSGDFNFIYLNFYMFDFSFIIFILIILASFTKSAQIPFSSWLPAAMAAPTPVSSLVHSSTLVTAGVYLLIRFNNLIYMYDSMIPLYLSMITMFMSGLGANFEFDLKKIIALSTLSQLGLMMSLLFLGFPLLSFFHMLSHAFFKALLFLCAGLMIHCINDSQDIRNMGGLVNYLPYTSSCFCISNFSLCGLPFLSGFYSKDLGLELLSFSTTNFFLYSVFYLSIGLTVSYTIRLIYYLLMGGNNLYTFISYSECMKMTGSMIFLSFMAVMGGSLMSWLIFINPVFFTLPLTLKLMSFFIVFLGGVVGYFLSYYCFSYTSLHLLSLFWYNYFSLMWFMPNFSTYMIYSKSSHLFINYSNFMDCGWGEFLFSKSIFNFLVFLSLLNDKLKINYFKVSLLIYLMVFIYLCIL
uniref:NADH-ubiquinone oxidoreductase chain 5 n=1 Tax=Opistholeptus burmanus TaxID=2813440 RepID=A0A8T9ZWH2_9HEMI|nr:NADH dehydrogenase subunit 5 [Opistholeptus burmanus]